MGSSRSFDRYLKKMLPSNASSPMQHLHTERSRKLKIGLIRHPAGQGTWLGTLARRPWHPAPGNLDAGSEIEGALVAFIATARDVVNEDRHRWPRSVEVRDHPCARSREGWLTRAMPASSFETRGGRPSCERALPPAATLLTSPDPPAPFAEALPHGWTRLVHTAAL